MKSENADNAGLSPEIERLDRYLKSTVTGCDLCESPGGEVLWEDDFCRVVRVSDADYPMFCRVVLRTHAAEMTDLAEADRQRLMRVVFAVESALRALCVPDKINLASFGNVVPHLHWHVIPRWRDDRHFPQPVWGSAQRAVSPSRPAPGGRQLGELIGSNLAGIRTES